MKVAELFVALGIKGGDKTKKDLGDTNTALKGAYDSSLALKAAIVGVAIGLERMTGWASQVGMDLHKFGVSTGLSTQELQNWQYMAMKFDVSGQEVAETIKSIQSQMSKMEVTGEQPGGLAFIAEKLKEAGKEIDIQRAFRDKSGTYMLGKYAEFAKLKNVPIGISNEMLKTTGLSMDMIQMLRLINTERDKISKQDLLTQNEQDRLTAMNIKWKEFWFTLRTMGLKFVANDMGEIIDAVADFGRGMRRAGDFIVEMMEKFKILKPLIITIGVAIAAWLAPITTLVAGIAYVISELEKIAEHKKTLAGAAVENLQDTSVFKGATSLDNTKFGQWLNNLPFIKSITDAFYGRGAPSAAEAAVPPTSASNQVTGANQQSIEQNNTFYIQGQDAKDNASEMQRGLNQAARQSFAQLVGG